METLTTRSAEANAQAAPAGTLTHPLSNWPQREMLPGLPPQVFAMFAGTYATMVLALWAFFGTDINAMIALGIATVYFGMYFGIPIWMTRTAERASPQASPKGTLSRLLSGDVDIYTGPVSGWGAIAQLMTIPVGLTLGFIAIGIIIRLGA